jgi:hypothetical protein
MESPVFRGGPVGTNLELWLIDQSPRGATRQGTPLAILLWLPDCGRRMDPRPQCGAGFILALPSVVGWLRAGQQRKGKGDAGIETRVRGSKVTN